MTVWLKDGKVATRFGLLRGEIRVQNSLHISLRTKTIYILTGAPRDSLMQWLRPPFLTGVPFLCSLHGLWSLECRSGFCSKCILCSIYVPQITGLLLDLVTLWAQTVAQSRSMLAEVCPFVRHYSLCFVLLLFADNVLFWASFSAMPLRL